MLNGRQFRTGVGQHSYAMFHDVTIAVIMRTANIIDSFYIAASSTLLIHPLVYYVESNVILIYDTGQVYDYRLWGDIPHWAVPRLISL